ncbi:hypothetical protein MJO28_017072 [Puccinia striiformis f. sp. tritici]|nr:hypothetical protein MJO28_017072 [Puccinia striiformis f. sp. tritici]
MEQPTGVCLASTVEEGSRFAACGHPPSRLPEHHENHLVRGVQPTGVPLVSLGGGGTIGATHAHPPAEVPRYHGDVQTAIAGLPN